MANSASASSPDAAPQQRTRGEPVVRIRELHKHYGRGRSRVHVLRGVSLDIAQGEFISIIGTSGSGKTTLLNVIGGLDRNFRGEVTIRGQDLRRLSDRRLSRLRNETMGFVFQAFNLLPHITCEENVMVPAYFSSAGLHESRERARRLLDQVGLSDKHQDRPTELSGGQRQRVAIARAMFNRPALILCDEPTGSLDQSTGRQILRLFRELNARDHITFVLVTHDEKISQACDRVIRIEDGVILSDTHQEPVPLDEEDAAAAATDAAAPAPAAGTETAQPPAETP